MFIVDDILLSPCRSILWIFQEIHDAAQQELADQAASITAELSRAYMQLETQQITEEEFQVREKELLDRLDEIERRGGVLENVDNEEENRPGTYIEGHSEDAAS